MAGAEGRDASGLKGIFAVSQKSTTNVERTRFLSKASSLALRLQRTEEHIEDLTLIIDTRGASRFLVCAEPASPRGGRDRWAIITRFIAPPRATTPRGQKSILIGINLIHDDNLRRRAP